MIWVELDGGVCYELGDDSFLLFRANWEFPKIRGYLRVPLKGYYKGSCKGVCKGCIEFPKIGGTFFGGPYNKDPTT